MENKLVIGILNIVEDKLREFGVQLPDDDREDSQDPIVGYQYAELHDRIQEYLQEQGVLQDRHGYLQPVKQREEDLRKVCVLTCVHETRHGASLYGSAHPSYQAAIAHVETVQKNCDFEEKEGEYFTFDIDEDVLDVSKLAITKPLSITEQEMQDMAKRGDAHIKQAAENEMRSLDSQIDFAESFVERSVSDDAQKGVPER